MGLEPCKAPGNPDSDGRTLIEERVQFGYETPVHLYGYFRSEIPYGLENKISLDIDGYV